MQLGDDQPDAQISAYTDGSVKFPKSIFSVASFGIFLPGRVHADVPHDMLVIAKVVDIGELPANSGTALGGTLGRFFQSSARAELAGLTTGLMSLLRSTSAWATWVSHSKA